MSFPLLIETQIDLSNAPKHLQQWFLYTLNIPQEMRAVPRWSVWQRQEDGQKIPYRVLRGPSWSRSERCKSDTPQMWVSFDEALHCFLQSSGLMSGLSFALGDGWMGFDFDDVIVDGQVHPQAEAWLEQLGGYREVSQSGKGIKTILGGQLSESFLGSAETGRQFKSIPQKGMVTEVYHCRRFFFLTGQGSGEATPNQSTIDEICSELVALKEEIQPKPKPKLTRRNATHSPKLSDDAILEKIRTSRQADKFESLWNGHLANYDSHSEADMALTSLLMWWCNNDASQVERLFEQSELAKRDKWNREDYRERTLAKAMRSDGYQPRQQSKRQNAAFSTLRGGIQ